MITGKPPFKASNDYQTFLKITSCTYEFPESCPQVIKDLIQKILVLDPSERFGAVRNTFGTETDFNPLKKDAFFNWYDFSIFNTYLYLVSVGQN